MHPVRWISVGLLLGVIAAAAGQLLSPFHLMTHEFSQTFAIVGSFVALHAGALAMSRYGLWERAWTVSIAAGLSAGLGADLTMRLANEAVHDCDTTNTVAFFWITWVPVMTLASTVGQWLHGRRWWTRTAAFLGLAALAALHDSAQFYWAPRQVDPLIGLLEFLDQRAAMTVPAVHAAGRAWLLGVAITLGLWGWARQRNHVRPLAWLCTVTMSLITLFGGSHLGLGISDAALMEALDEEHQTPHFVLRFGSQSATVSRLAIVEDLVEWRYDRLSADLGVEAKGPITILIFDAKDELKRVTGGSSAQSSGTQIILQYWDLFDDTLPHEIVHALHDHRMLDPTLFIRGYTEGLAMAFDDRDYARYPAAHSQIAAAHATGVIPSLEQVFSVLGFFQLHETNAYRYSGSFLGFLNLEYGTERLWALEESANFEATYGKSLGTLEVEWLAFLETVPVQQEEVAKARETFDPVRAPATLAKRCPKLRPRHLTLKERAQRWLRAGLHAPAQKAFAELWEADGDPRWLWSQVQALQFGGEHEAALAVLATIPIDSQDQSYRALNARITSLLHQRDWKGLYAAFDQRRTIQPATGQRIEVERLLRDPEVRDDLAPILVMRDDWTKGEPLRALAARLPDDPGLAMLLASTAGRPRRTGAEDNRFPLGQPALVDPTSCNTSRWDGLLHYHLDHRDCVGARPILAAMEAVCTEGGDSGATARARHRWDYIGCTP